MLYLFFYKKCRLCCSQLLTLLGKSVMSNQYYYINWKRFLSWLTCECYVKMYVWLVWNVEREWMIGRFHWQLSLNGQLFSVNITQVGVFSYFFKTGRCEVCYSVNAGCFLSVLSNLIMFAWQLCLRRIGSELPSVPFW